MLQRTFSFLILFLLALSCKSQSIISAEKDIFGLPAHENDSLVRAFPGAEGGGMYTTGGRGGRVIKVTNLEDAGPGSLRKAIQASGARTIVFDVDGIIELKSPLKINKGDVTIAGQTAPGDGICLKNYSLVVNADNVIIRFIRCRMGDEVQAKKASDAMEGRFRKNIIIDHCSMSWCTDECSSFYANENFTMQWCIIAESLRNSGHDKGTHGYGAIWGGVNASFHHNLLAHHDSRNPRFDGADVYAPASTASGLHTEDRAVDYRNCVVYNFSNLPAYGGEGQRVNFVGNYYKQGPGSTGGPGVSYDTNGRQKKNSVKNREFFYSISKEKEEVDYAYPSVYLDGNTNYFMPDRNGLNADNRKGFVATDGAAFSDFSLTSPVRITPDNRPAKVTYHTAEDAYSRVLDYAGASLKRDAVDARAVGDTRSGDATCMAGSNGSINGYIDSPKDVGGWPVYNRGMAKVDTDGDGIPDEWEDLAGMDKNLASDGNAKTLDPSGRYTNLEVYLHYLVKDIINRQNKGGDYITQ